VTTKYTLQDGLAFVVITGTKRFLTWRTSVAMIGYEDLDLETVRNVVNEEGMELARRSRIWKAHEHMLSLGFTADRDRRRNTPRFIYYKAEDGRHGFISKGSVWVSPANKWSSEKVATFKNGEG